MLYFVLHRACKTICVNVTNMMLITKCYRKLCMKYLNKGCYYMKFFTSLLRFNL